MANVIYRSPIKDEPETVSNKTVAGAYLPGILVTEVGDEFVMLTAADTEADVLVLSNRRFMGQAITTAYADGDTGVAYRPRPGEIYHARMAAATYAYNDPLTMGADGRLAAAGASERVVAHFVGVPGAFSAGDFADVRIANSFTSASA